MITEPCEVSVCAVFKKDAKQAKNKQANKTLQAPELTP